MTIVKIYAHKKARESYTGAHKKVIQEIKIMASGRRGWKKSKRSILFRNASLAFIIPFWMYIVVSLCRIHLLTHTQTDLD